MDKEFIVLVGNIGTGKTTYCNAHFSDGYVIVRPDDWPKMAKEQMDEKFNGILFDATKQGKSLVIDGTNVKASTRKRLLQYSIGYGYKTIAIDFGAGNDHSLEIRLIEPREWTKEQIRNQHIEHIELYETPTIDEGFDEIIKIKTKNSMNYEIGE